MRIELVQKVKTAMAKHKLLIPEEVKDLNLQENDLFTLRHLCAMAALAQQNDPHFEINEDLTPTTLFAALEEIPQLKDSVLLNLEELLEAIETLDPERRQIPPLLSKTTDFQTYIQLLEQAKKRAEELRPWRVGMDKDLFDQKELIGEERKAWPLNQ